VAFVVDGWALEIALKHYRKAFTELAVLSRTAICCRVTPSQKAQVFFFTTVFVYKIMLPCLVLRSYVLHYFLSFSSPFYILQK